MPIDNAVGAEAQDFLLTAPDGQEWRLSDRRGKVVALLFYPGNETLVCTKQLCSVRDNWERYVASGAEVVGISPGSADEHSQFAARHGLPLKLLIDSNRQITEQFVKHSIWPIWTTRGIVIIDANGIIRFRDVMLRAFRPSDDEVLSEIHLAHYELLTKK